MFTFRHVTDPAELEAVYRLRFDIYATELGHTFPDAVASGRIVEPADETGYNLAAFTPSGEVAAALRFNLLKDGLPPPYPDMFAAVGVTVPEPEVTTITSRFLLRKEFRAGTVGASLMSFGFHFGWPLGARRDWIVVAPHLVEMYLRLGYVPLRKDLFHPNGGPVSLLELDMTADTLFRRLAHRGIAA